ncbi:Carbohydrate esterase 4 protein [Serendipita sp. 396]|nr:Carbohydrate esterase 4 protein [Serendipita sp. 396]KAG8819191.1 Carbohydrate esterase 4 protein [Serendipita sp. 400]KAG8848476.1 Carbohydrate esterase 4 protein [Serendipita sp. 405]
MGKGELSEESPDEQAGNQQSSHRPSGQVHTTTSGNRQMMANKTAHNDIRAAFNNVGGKTTFFANGDNWSCIYDQNNVDALRGSFEAGHQIASHTWSYVVALPYLPQA